MSSLLFTLAIVLFLLAIAVLGFAAVLFMRSQNAGQQQQGGVLPPQSPPQQAHPPHGHAPGAHGGVQMQAPPPAPALPSQDDGAADEEMPTVIVSQPEATRPGGPGSVSPSPGQRTAGATIIAFDDDDDDDF